MKILFLSQIVPYPPHGGVLQRGYNLVRQLADRNEVHLLAFVHPDVLNTPNEINESRAVLEGICESVSYFELWPKKTRAHALAAFGLGYFATVPFSAIAHWSRAFANEIRRVVTSTQIDVVHFDTIGLAPFLSQVPNKPRVLTHHNIESQLMARRAEVEPWPARHYLEKQAKRLHAYEREVSTRFDLNIVVSHADGLNLQKIAPDVSFRVVPNGVDVSYFTPVESPDSPRVIYTGGMNMFANKDAVQYFVDTILPLIHSQEPDVCFDIVGQDPPPALISRSEADSKLHVHGFVSDIRPLVSEASVYVVPIRVGGGTRLKVLDAMAMGKAIVSTRVGCEGIEVTNGQNILIEDDPTRFAEHVVRLIRDAEFREVLGSEARRLAEARYSWEPISRKLEGAYSEAIAMHGPGR